MLINMHNVQTWKATAVTEDVNTVPRVPRIILGCPYAIDRTLKSDH